MKYNNGLLKQQEMISHRKGLDTDLGDRKAVLGCGGHGNKSYRGHHLVAKGRACLQTSSQGCPRVIKPPTPTQG